MKKYTDEQLAILRSLTEAPIEIKDTRELDITSPYILLRDDKLTYGAYENTPRGRLFVIRITERGKAYLATLDSEISEKLSKHRDDRFRWWATTGIAIYAAIISTIALVKSFF